MQGMKYLYLISFFVYLFIFRVMICMDKTIKNITDIVKIYRENRNLYSVTIEITSFCNWRCEHCYISEYTQKGFDEVTFRNLLIQLREMGTFEIVFTGGEVFAHPDAMIYIKLAREMFFNVIVYSNISMLNKHSIKTLSNLYIDYISCTIFSMDETVHDRITNKKGSLKKCLQNLGLLKEFGIQIEIKTPLFEQNIHSIDNVFEFCKKNNFKYKVDTQIVPRRGTVNNKVRVKSLTLKQLITIQKKIDIINGVRFIDKNENFLTCSSVQISLYITCLGSVQPCSLYSISIGNIYHTSIKEIWNKSMFNKIATYSLKDSKNCSTCTIANYCTQCPGIALSESGNSRNCSEICKKTALARSFVYASIP